MARQRHTPKGRLLITGTVLLILLVAGILTAGRTINGVAVQMSGRIVRHISEYHYRLLQVEFERSEGVLDASVQFMRERTAPTDAELHVLAATLMRMDPKAGGVWFAEAGGRTIRSYPRGKTPRTTEAAGDFRQRLIAATDGDSVRSHVTGSGRIQVWSMACPVTDRTGRRHICGIDFPLPEIYTCMTQSPASSGYATLFDPEGVIVYHPDSLKLGRPASDSTGLAAFRKVAATGQSVTVHAISDYLNIDEERIYYPIQLGGRRWVAGIGIPRLVIEQEIDDFHFYTVFAAVISVLFFAVLLVLAQRRWRREYDLRRHSERESAQLHLQQLLEQIDPHFLFNSLNSLYALIRCNPDQAREFTLTLSRVYRRVLERRKQILSTLAEEIDFTWQYYTLQKIRFDDRIELTSAIDPALRNWRIPDAGRECREAQQHHGRQPAAHPHPHRGRKLPDREQLHAAQRRRQGVARHGTGTNPLGISVLHRREHLDFGRRRNLPVPSAAAAARKVIRLIEAFTPPIRAFAPDRFSGKHLNFIIASCGFYRFAR